MIFSPTPAVQPTAIHFERARSWLCARAGWTAGGASAARIVFEQTEHLRRWYEDRTKPSRPLRWRAGYLFAYAALGYDRLDVLASRVPGLARVLGDSSTGAVMGCGPCPELWSISRRTKPGGLRLALFDEFVDDWLGAITGFTHPLVEESLNRANASMPELRLGAGGVEAFARIEGRFDFVLAQQSMNEQVYRGPRREDVLRRWLTDHLNPGGAVIVIERRRQWLERLLDGGPGRDSLPARILSIPGRLRSQDSPGIDWPCEASSSYKPRTKLEMHGAVLFAELSGVSAWASRSGVYAFGHADHGVVVVDPADRHGYARGSVVFRVAEPVPDWSSLPRAAVLRPALSGDPYVLALEKLVARVVLRDRTLLVRVLDAYLGGSASLPGGHAFGAERDVSAVLRHWAD